jgi:two-component sensor histidine kinase
LKEEIKERQVAENQLEHSIGEKTILLKEVHHRVKNNLAVITGLIRMQSRRIDDPTIKSMFTDLQNRVKTMELIHTNLYASKDFNKIDMSHYLDSLAKNLGQSFSKKQGDVSFNIDCEELFLNIDQAITCGQIVNELVTNAFKHAFKGQTDGKITITMEEDDDLCTLVVKDNGRGTKKADPEKFSLGLSLVHELTRYQLKGNVNITEENGLKYQISFKKS